MAISRAAGPDGARNTSGTTSKHAAAPPERRAWPGCWWAASGPGRASRRRAQPPISHHAPLLWRAPEGPEGTGGLRDDAPSHAQRHKRRRCGGRRRVRRARAGFEIDHSEPQARVWRSRGRPGPTAPATPAAPQVTRAGRPPPTSTHSGRARRRPQHQRHHKHPAPSNHATQTRGSPSGPPRVHATSSYSTRSRGRAFSAVAGPRPRRPGPR